MHAEGGSVRRHKTARPFTATLPESDNQPASLDNAALALIDRNLHSGIATLTGGISPVPVILASQDWLMHLALSPGKQTDIALKAQDKIRRFFSFLLDCGAKHGTGEPCISPLPQDRRFDDPAWQHFPFNVIQQAFLLNQQLWHNATTGIPGVTHRHAQLVEFYSRQFLDMVSPSNFLATNPELLRVTAHERGTNLLRGYGNFLADVYGLLSRGEVDAPDDFRPGRDVAVTDGKVVFRNELLELIQYTPTTDKVKNEPILVVPAWIMKYYILDLSPGNSLIRYLVGQGFTVFAISWRNPGPDMRDTSFDAYRSDGICTAISAVRAICGDRPIHSVGYCLGGTLLLIAAAALAKQKNPPLCTVSLLAAQGDFSEAGELTLFIDESQIDFIEDLMWRKGYLDAGRMLGAFQLLRSRDLIWSRMVHNYLLGGSRPRSDLLAWNADATRMPFRMHSEYLRKLFLHNDLAEGNYKVDGQAVFLEDIREPTFLVSTVRDHVAPWHSVFKLTHLLDSEVTFILASGGHNTGIVAPPGQPMAQYWHSPRSTRTAERDPQRWQAQAVEVDGSWWPAWSDWLHRRSSGQRTPPPMGNAAAGYAPLCDAPGTYVLQR